jgi:hypothetical protein
LLPKGQARSLEDLIEWITPIQTKSPQEQLNIDYTDLKKSSYANGNFRYLLNCIDHFSKFLWSFPLKSRDSDLAAEKIRGLFQLGHVPKVLHADGEFSNHELMKVCTEYNVVFVKSGNKYHY